MSNQWKEAELLVKLIEEQVSPDALIEHNVFLPVLSSTTGVKRQCDLVIRTGQKPRQTISIVEIQDRNRKVDITIFDGWMQKMKDVGAQHLICVSKKGFPKSVEEKARFIGPTVRLVKLEEFEDGEWPIEFLRKNVIILRKKFLSVNDFKINFKSDIEIPEHEITIDPNSMTLIINNT